MGTSVPPSHLSQIETRWTALFRAHQGATDTAAEARADLMLRYSGAVHRYLLKVTGDPGVADDLAQDFAVRFLRGDFRNAQPGRGRFRDFVKRAVRNLVTDHHRRRRARPRGLAEGDPRPVEPPPDGDALDRPFLESWREEMMARAWDELARHEEGTGQPYHTVLRFRADHPDLRSPKMAEILTDRLGKPVTPGWVRQVLLRAREMFVDLLIAEVARSLQTPSRETLEEELIALELLDYCRPGLDRFPGA